MQQTMSQKKRYITLIEIMIVMFLIALIAGVIAYNYRGSLDAGRAFSTEQNIIKIKNILELEGAKQRISSQQQLATDMEKILKSSPLVKDSDQLMKDGWGSPLKVSVVDDELVFSSDKWDEYKKDHPEYKPAAGAGAGKTP